MAERHRTKRDLPEDGRSSEAEATPSSSATATKRIRLEAEPEGGASADSTTLGLYDLLTEDSRPAEVARHLRDASSAIDGRGSPLACDSPAARASPVARAVEPAPTGQQDRPSSTSEDGPQPVRAEARGTGCTTGALPLVPNNCCPQETSGGSADHPAVGSSSSAGASSASRLYGCTRTTDPALSSNSEAGTAVTELQCPMDEAISTTAIVDAAGTSDSSRGGEPARAESTPAEAEGEPAGAESTRAMAEGDPVGAEVEPAGAEGEPAGAEGEPAGAESTRASAEGDPVGPEGTPAGAEGTPVGAEDNPVGAESAPARAEGTPVGAKGTPAGAEGTPVGAEDNPVGAESVPARAEGTPVGAEATPALAEGTLARAEGTLVGAEGTPVGAEGTPVGAEGTPAGRATRRGLREADVGILEYISKHKGFHGVIKQRYQDFLVNEVDSDGTIVHLTDVSSPDPPAKASVNIDTVLNDHDQRCLQELAASTDKKACHCIEVDDFEKDARKRIHEVIRQHFATLESSTLDVEGKKVIKVTKVTRGGGRNQRSNWDKSRPNFCRFVLHKENMEVNEALTLISKYSHVKQHSFGFSGTKDKRAITAQEVTVYRVEAERLCRLNSILRGIRMGNFRYVKDPLTLGDHSGNHFVIILRDVDGCLAEIEQALTSMRDTGFINYFGMQRFGNSQMATHLVGRAVLHSNWKEAVDLILKPREGNLEMLDHRWRHLWMETRDAKAVLNALPKRKTISIEMQLLKGLKESRNDYPKAMQCIPRNVRLLYVHSYQSYIWNVVTSRRIQKYGLNVLEGDLVLKERQPGEESEHLQTSVIDGTHLDRYSIQDIVLPLPGFAVQYPQNELGDWYRELLKMDGLDIDNMRHRIKEYSLSGTYRKIVVKPADVSWAILLYSDTTIPLALSDLDRLEGRSLPLGVPDGNLRALKLEFTLPSSCYATMALREVLKTDTSAGHQGTLNPIKQAQPDQAMEDPAD